MRYTVPGLSPLSVDLRLQSSRKCMRKGWLHEGAVTPGAGVPEVALYLSRITDLPYREAVYWKRLLKTDEDGTKPARIYFGNEFCQERVPEKVELEASCSAIREAGLPLSFVTPPVNDRGCGILLKRLTDLQIWFPGSEVVVNDWGVLAMATREFSNVKPVLGRLMVRQQRMARFARRRLPPVNTKQIQTPAETLRASQLEALRRVNLSCAEYRHRLRALGVRRVDIDIVPQGIEMPKDAWGFGVGCYYPWTYITGGRNCLTGALADQLREHVVVDGRCPKPCRELNRSKVNDLVGMEIAQRGNSVFLANYKFAEPYLSGLVPVDRLILEPYIPI